MDFDNYYIGKIPIPIVTPEEQQSIVNLVEQIVAARREDPAVDISTEEREIDRLVYNLYGVIEAESEIVKSSIGEKKS